MSPKVMKLLNPSTGLMECRSCGSRHHATLTPGGRLARGSWQCVHGCKEPEDYHVKREHNVTTECGIPVGKLRLSDADIDRNVREHGTKR